MKLNILNTDFKSFVECFSLSNGNTDRQVITLWTRFCTLLVSCDPRTWNPRTWNPFTHTAGILWHPSAVTPFAQCLYHLNPRIYDPFFAHGRCPLTKQPVKLYCTTHLQEYLMGKLSSLQTKKKDEEHWKFTVNTSTIYGTHTSWMVPKFTKIAIFWYCY